MLPCVTCQVSSPGCNYHHPSLPLSAQYFDERKQKISNNFDSRLLFVPFSSPHTSPSLWEFVFIRGPVKKTGYFRWTIIILPVSVFLRLCNNLASYRVVIIIPVTPIRLAITIISELNSPLWPVSRTRAQDKRESRTFFSSGSQQDSFIEEFSISDPK